MAFENVQQDGCFPKNKISIIKFLFHILYTEPFKKVKTLNGFWIFLIILSFVIGVIKGDVERVGQTLFSSLKSIADIFLTISLSLILWSGFLKIAIDVGLIETLKKLIRPVLEHLFKTKDQKAFEYMSINIISNLFGLGNAATPAGIKAIEQLDKNNNTDALSDDMILFIILNTCSIQIIPTTIIMVRSSYYSKSPAAIIFPVLFVSILGVIFGIALCKIFSKVWKR